MTESGARDDPYIVTVRTSLSLGDHACVGSPIRLYVSPNEIDPTKSTVALAMTKSATSSDTEPLWSQEDEAMAWWTFQTYRYSLRCLDRYNNIIQGRLSDELCLSVSVSGIDTKDIEVYTNPEGDLSFDVVAVAAGKGHVVVSTPTGRFQGTPMSVVALESKSGLDGGKSSIMLEPPGRTTWDDATSVEKGRGGMPSA